MRKRREGQARKESYRVRGKEGGVRSLTVHRRATAQA